jgi:hypothetical protein
MAKSWATLGVDLHLDDRHANRHRHRRPPQRPDGRAARRRPHRPPRPGTRLPSSRSLAADLGIARNTVADAYADLVAEGWLTARQGSGTRVAERAGRPAHGRPPPRRLRPAAPPTTSSPAPPTSPPSPAPSGSRPPAEPSPPPRTRPSATATRAAASNCAPPSPPTSPAPAAYAPTPNSDPDLRRHLERPDAARRGAAGPRRPHDRRGVVRPDRALADPGARRACAPARSPSTNWARTPS